MFCGINVDLEPVVGVWVGSNCGGCFGYDDKLDDKLDIQL